jgi:formylglycine-generating enzyme required for sulfatase activity
MTDPANIRRIGAALNAKFVLSANFRSLGTNRYFSAAILDIELGDQDEGARKQYQSMSEGLTLMAEIAKELTGVTVRVPVPEMVRINGGTFTMGSPANEQGRWDTEGPQHQVTVNSFYMGKYEVTQKEYQEVIGGNPSCFRGDNLPVDQVTWYDAIEYCNALSQKEGLTPAYTIDKSRQDPNNKYTMDGLKWLITWNRNANGYRLPSEAEWEYACRAGTTTAWNTGATAIDNTGWFNNNSGRQSHPVGQKPANRWGLHDMHGNVFEWCWDWHGPYADGAQTNPMGATSGSERVNRGGDHYNNVWSGRSASRLGSRPTMMGESRGFRIARN